MTQDVMELLAGAGYGVVKGVVKSFVPGSTGAFNYMDKCIKDVSPAAALSQCVGEKVGKGLVGILLVL